MALRKGQVVRVRCVIQPGPFSHERLVTVQSCDGPVSGFVRLAFLEEASGSETGFIRGQIVKAEKDRVLVRLPGSFFTTNGVTTVSPDEVKLAA